MSLSALHRPASPCAAKAGRSSYGSAATDLDRRVGWEVHLHAADEELKRAGAIRLERERAGPLRALLPGPRTAADGPLSPCTRNKKCRTKLICNGKR